MRLHPVLFQLGPLTVHSWGFMLALAVIIGIIGTGKILKKNNIDPDTSLDVAIVSVLSGLLGARLLYFFIYERELLFSQPWAVFLPEAAGFSGLIWYGGFLGGFIGCLLYIQKKKLPFWLIADIFAPFTALGYAIVRIGCFLAGCCHGRICSSPPGVVFPAVDQFARHPTQLYSSAVNFIIFLFLIWYLPRKKFDGQIFLIYLIAYSVYRFFMEFLRANLVMYGPLSNSQFYSLILFVAAVLIYYCKTRDAD